MNEEYFNKILNVWVETMGVMGVYDYDCYIFNI